MTCNVVAAATIANCPEYAAGEKDDESVRTAAKRVRRRGDGEEQRAADQLESKLIIECSTPTGVEEHPWPTSD